MAVAWNSKESPALPTPQPTRVSVSHLQNEEGRSQGGRRPEIQTGPAPSARLSVNTVSSGTTHGACLPAT